jgi:YVTN family beta-propeller protein
VVGTVAVGANPEGILYDPASNEVFVASMWSNTVSVISGTTNDVVATVSVDSTPYGLAWNNATNQVYVTCMNFTGSRSLIDVISGSTLQVTATISLGRTYPDGIAFVPSLNEIFVDNAGGSNPTSNLTVLSATTYQTLANITLPSAAAPGQIVYDDSTGDLYIAGAGYFVDGLYPNDIVVNPVNRSIVATIPVGSGPEAIASVPGTADLFALAEYNDTVCLIGGTTDNISSTVTLPSGTFPDGIAYDPASHQVFVSDWGTDSVSYLVYQVVYPVAFTESGLPAGLNWSVTVNGTSWSSNSSTLSFPEPNGTYSYTIASSTGFYLSTTSPGSFTVAGVALFEITTFVLPAYTVSFTEQGLPAGTNWSVAFNGTVANSSTTRVSFQEPNGTFIRDRTIGGISLEPVFGERHRERGQRNRFCKLHFDPTSEGNDQHQPGFRDRVVWSGHLFYHHPIVWERDRGEPAVYLLLELRRRFSDLDAPEPRTHLRVREPAGRRHADRHRPSGDSGQ